MSPSTRVSGRTVGVGVLPAVLVLSAGALSERAGVRTPDPDAARQEAPSWELATLFEPGNLVLDENGDGVPDRLGATLVLPAESTPVELAAAAEIAARLGFETSALELPLGRGVLEGQVAVVVGSRAAADAGLELESEGGQATGAGRAQVWTLARDGHRWLVVFGDTDDALAEAARMVAGRLPHTRTLSDPALSAVQDDIGRWLAADTTAGGFRVSFHAAYADPSAPGLAMGLVGTVEHDVSGQVPSALSRLDSLARARGGEAAPADSSVLRFPGLATVTLAGEGFEGSVALSVSPAPPPPGPVPGRPGAGAKTSLDLSNVYSTEGALADTDDNEIPDRVDVVLVPGGTGSAALPELAARLGLESTGLTVPLVRPADDVSDPGDEATMVLVGADHPLTKQLADSGRISLDALEPGQGLVELVPAAFGRKSAIVATGMDAPGADAATRFLAERLPALGSRRPDAPTLDDVEHELQAFLAGHAPAGQAATAVYKLDRILEKLAAEGVGSADVLISVEKPEAELEALVRTRMAAAGVTPSSIAIDDRDVQSAAEIFAEDVVVPSEVERFRAAFREQVLPSVGPGARVSVEARLSEPPELRRTLEREALDALRARGAHESSSVVVLSAFKQGFSWIDEVVKPAVANENVGRIVIRFLENEPPPEWPQQAIHTPVRWLHEIFPIDEVLARDLDLDLDRIDFDMVEEGPTYGITVFDSSGREILSDSFDPKWVLRPYFDRFRDYEQVRVTTGWISADVDGDRIVDERIVTDPEWVWDHFQASTLHHVYDYVMDRHDGNPRGGSQDAPYFGELTVDLTLSEPDYRLGIDNEIIAPMDALHEEIYFGTIEFFHLLGRNARGSDLTYPGRILPRMHPRSDGGDGRLRTRLTGFATQRPAVVVRYATAEGDSAEMRLDVSKVEMERPSVRRIVVTPPAAEGATPSLDLSLRVRVDTERDVRDSLLTYATPERVDESMISAEQVAAALANLEALRERGAYPEALAWDGVGDVEVWAEWAHEQDPETRVAAALPPNGAPAPLPEWRDLVPDGWQYDGERLVQWETPMPPPEGHRILAQMAAAFDEASMMKVGESYLGKTTWALELSPPVDASHRSMAKVTTFKPTVVYSARQHANEVSSTSHVLRHAELLLTDPEQRRKLDRVNVVIHPFTNPDGAQLAYDLYEETPDYILHAGYLGSLGMDATSGSGDDHPIYPEASVRPRIWERWLPDIFLNPHGYPSHQVVQLFSEYTGLVRRGRVTERNWGFNKGWFMPGFGYVDDPRYPRHRDAAFEIRDYITRGINANRDVHALNQRSYDRYRRYGAEWDPDVFRLPMVDSVLIEMPLKGSRGGNGGGGYNPNVTIWSGTTEAPDETAYGDWMELVAKAGLSWDQAILDYLVDGDHEVERSGSSFFGGVTLTMNRPRPPEVPDDEDGSEAPSGDPG